MAVSVLYYKVSSEHIDSPQYSQQRRAWTAELPEAKRSVIQKLKRPIDQFLSIAGLQLLKIGVSEFSQPAFSLSDVQFPGQGKPFYPGDIDFNISHSGEVVCCVLSDDLKVGIDIELQRPVHPATMNKVLAAEPGNVKNGDGRDFFSIWTRKEAIIKAADFGSIGNMGEVSLESRGGRYHNQFWYCYPVDILPYTTDTADNAYTCYIACEDKITDLYTRQIDQL